MTGRLSQKKPESYLWGAATLRSGYSSDQAFYKRNESGRCSSSMKLDITISKQA